MASTADDGDVTLYSIADDLTSNQIAQVGEVPDWSVTDGPYFGPTFLVAFGTTDTYLGVLQ
jgi:hypothetical protein